MNIEHRMILDTEDRSKPSNVDYVLSDESLDLHGTIIEADGWKLERFRANPVALFNHDKTFVIGQWYDIRSEGRKLKAKLKLLKAGVSSRLDEIRAAVEAGFLRGVSVGFAILPGGAKRDAGGTVRISLKELVEASLVAVPSNRNSLAEAARGIGLSDRGIDLLLGENARTAEGNTRTIIGENAVTKTIVSQGNKKMSLAQRIQETEAEINGFRDQLQERTANFDGTDEGINTEVEELNRKIEESTRKLDILKKSEANLAARSAPVIPGNVPGAAGGGQSTAVVNGNRPFAAPARKIEPKEYFFRSAVVHAVAAASGKNWESVLHERYGEDESTQIYTRAAVAGATTTAAGWAAELVNTVMTDFLETLRPVSVYPALSAMAGGRLAFGPNQGAIKIPSRASTPSIGGSFVGEGAPIPVRRLGLQSITLTPKKMGVLSVFSREIARYSTPAIETLIRQEIIADTAITLDSLLLDAVAGSAVRPAGITNGVTPLTATAGGGYAAILGDIRKLRAPFDLANSSRNLVLIVNPAQLEALNLTPGADGTLGWAAGIVGRYNVIASTGVTAGTLIMLDASDFVTATGDAPEFEVSQEATIHMEDTTPLQIGTAGSPATIAAPTQSMFQTAQLAIRMLMDVSWAMRRSGMVQTITGATW
jgi:HK97 family phage prohead protease/HK97 family phage major capsid protein